jgi:formylglycine-generating enzyme required for sulfatase activity/uncharacterized caspase-like protein
MANWAIAIGINQYKNLQNLDYAKDDAKSIQNFFIKEAGFQQVYLFTENSPPIQGDRGPEIDSQPIYTSLKRFLRERFNRPFLTTGDNFWFFFAGHGIQHEGRDYLMPLDVDPGDINGTAIPVSLVTERLQRCGADNVILLIDACRKEGKKDGIGLGQEKQKGVVTIFSCSPNEFSYEIDELEHGSFTYALLEGLRLQGAGNCATVERLDDYLYRQVPQLNHQYRKPHQTPRTTIEPITKRHLILLPKQTTLLDDVKTLKLDAYQAERRRDWFTAKQLWIRVLAVSPADSDAIEAIERLSLGKTEVDRISKPDKPLVSRRQVIQWGWVTVGILGVGAITRILPNLNLDSEETPTEKPNQSLSIVELMPFSFEVVKVNEKGEETDRQIKEAKQFIEKLSDSVNLEMVQIPGGEFIMGAPETEERSSNSERPQHLVTVASFFIGKYPITQAQWKAIVTQVPKIQRDLKTDPSRFKGDNRPVEQVSWYDAVEFCARLSKYSGKAYSLPSEAQWEYACRAGTTTHPSNPSQEGNTPFHFGETITTDLVNYNGNSTYGSAPKGQYRGETTPVGSFKVANSFGLYDIHGNVLEWCLDDWHKNYEGAPTDGSAWFDDNKNLAEKQSNSVLRGGSWNDLLWVCRSAYRFFNVPRDNIGVGVGFRVVCVVPTTFLSP